MQAKSISDLMIESREVNELHEKVKFPVDSDNV